MRRWIEAVFCSAVAALVLFIYIDSSQISNGKLVEYYISNFYTDTGARNAVTAIYLNYRVFDSIFETLMLLISVTAVIYLSWRKENE